MCESDTEGGCPLSFPSAAAVVELDAISVEGSDDGDARLLPSQQQQQQGNIGKGGVDPSTSVPPTPAPAQRIPYACRLLERLPASQQSPLAASASSASASASTPLTTVGGGASLVGEYWVERRPFAAFGGVPLSAIVRGRRGKRGNNENSSGGSSGTDRQHVDTDAEAAGPFGSYEVLGEGGQGTVSLCYQQKPLPLLPRRLQLWYMYHPPPAAAASVLPKPMGL